MTEPSTTTYHVVNVDDESVVWKTDNLDKAAGVAEYLKAECDTEAVVTQVVLV